MLSYKDWHTLGRTAVVDSVEAAVAPPLPRNGGGRAAKTIDERGVRAIISSDATSHSQERPPRRRVEKIAERVARSIARDIVDRGLTPGSRLPLEADMIAEHNVARASLREALRILEVQGLVVIRGGPGGGPVVGGASASDFAKMATLHLQAAGSTFRELVNARLVLEPVLVAEAAKRAEPEVIAEMRTAVGGDISDTSSSTYIRRASDFHTIVLSGSGNSVLTLVATSIKEAWYGRVTGMMFPDDERDHVESDHSAIIDAIEAHDAPRAEALMRRHLEEYVRYCELRYPGVLDEIVEWR
ncbi:hypothetical protein PSU4_53460 [Pseudonocardia sulfidoxydans NBRC 16205]|uniref:HTH gntR-type domain-containing protein n=1 Tax=Pseudonocardia sulfidoxydans NBRC 16205 TaxID=1223511 RepID=A0A511DNJ8_9PSEU|nr:hypothetical protein PSU4_53460 [Pseudonocardia sulfidoxydans NBRC 16205]